VNIKLIAVILTLLFLALQYKLWCAPDGFWRIQRLKRQIAGYTKGNFQLSQRNEGLAREIKDLKISRSAVEAHARNDLNMTKPDELFYLILGKDNRDDDL